MEFIIDSLGISHEFIEEFIIFVSNVWPYFRLSYVSLIAIITYVHIYVQ